LFCALLACLSQDSTILRKMVTENERIPVVSCVLVPAWSCDAECRKQERRAAAMTASAAVGPAA